METERILLRPWQESDAETLFKYASDPDVGPRAGWPPHQSVEESLEIIRTVFSAEGMWAVIWKETDCPIGCVGYLPASASNLKIAENQAEVGYWIARPFWGKGFCTEALQLVIDYCFNEKGFTVLWGDYFPSNPASGRVMEKCGFVDTGKETLCPNLEVGSDHPVRVMKLERNLEVRYMTLRPFTINDAPIILSWIKDETAFRKWSADRYPVYPPMPEDMLAQYESGVIFPFTAIDGEGKVVGHIMLRYPDPSKTVIRFGFVIVDDQLRGKGYGKQMLQLAIQKAKNEFGAKKITLGVFDNNPSAFHCYESVGFKVIGTDSYQIDGEEWTDKEMEITIEL
jgi:RimJ/RimL family protein N-acetyltransferase